MEYSLFSEVYHMNLPASVPVIVQVIIFKLVIIHHEILRLCPAGAALERLRRPGGTLALGDRSGTLTLGRRPGGHQTLFL